MLRVDFSNACIKVIYCVVKHSSNDNMSRSHQMTAPNPEVQYSPQYLTIKMAATQ